MEVKFRVLKHESTFVGYCLLFSTQRISMPALCLDEVSASSTTGSTAKLSNQKRLRRILFIIRQAEQRLDLVHWRW